MSLPIRFGLSPGKRALDVVQAWIDDRRRERDDDPRPGAQRVVHRLKHKGAEERVGLGARGEHPLRDVASAARLGARIPHRPPQHGNRDHENGERVLGIGEVRQNRERGRVAAAKMRDEPVQAADARRVDREVRRRERRAHRDAELNHVGDHHAPETRSRGEDDRNHDADRERLPARPAEEDAGDLHQREVDRRDDPAVEEQPEIDRAEAAHERGRAPGVAQLVELEIGKHARAAPEPRVKEDGRHAGEQKRPPQPVFGDAAVAHQVRHEIRRVGRERRRDERDPDQPPRRLASGGKELGNIAPGAARQHDRRQKAHAQGNDDDDPIERRQVHGASAFVSSCEMTSAGTSVISLGSSP